MLRDDRGVALREIGNLFRAGTVAGIGDGALLERFLTARGEVAQSAFAAIIDRHGPMVLRVCRHALKHKDDADDAFQATFIALSRSAARIRKHDSVASWLHGTALRVSACARTADAKRKLHEGRFAALRLWRQPAPESSDLRAVIHEEVGRLPERFRAAIVLCDLEGLSHDEAAKQLGWPIGTIKSRVFRGRERLKSRLVRRGVAPAVALIGSLAAREANAAIRSMLVDATVQLAMGQELSSTVSAAVVLADLFQRSLFMGRLRMMVVSVVAVGVLAAGATLVAQQGIGPGPYAKAQPVPGRDGTFVKTYTVADLVLTSAAQVEGNTRPALDMNPLIDVLTTTIAPGTWRVLNESGVEVGERAKVDNVVGSIKPFDLSLSLIVRHTPEAHAQVAERLEQLRRFTMAREGNHAKDQEAGNAQNPGQGGAGGTGAMAGMMGGMMRGPGASTGYAGMMGAPPQPPPGAAAPSGAGAMMGMGMGMGSGPATTKGKSSRKPSAFQTAGGMPGMAGGGEMMGRRSGAPAELPPGSGAAAGMMREGNSGGSGMRLVPPPIDSNSDTQQRLRAVEEKLDRILKALDGSKRDESR